MFKRLNIVITGAARGIGEALAIKMSRRGHNVFVVGLEPEKLRKVATECWHSEWWHVCDVRDPDQLKEAFAAAADAFGGRIDVVVANAGIASRVTTDDPRFDDMLESTLAVNLRGGIYTSIAARPYLAQSHGYMLFVTSAAGLVNPPMMAPYNVSKGGLRAYAETFRLEVMPEGISVGVVTFTELDTDMTRIGFAGEAGERLLALKIKIGSKVLFEGRILPVAKLAPAVDALARGISHRRRHIRSPRRVLFIRLFPWFVQRVLIETFVRPRMNRSRLLSLEEASQFTTNLPPLD